MLPEYQSAALESVIRRVDECIALRQQLAASQVREVMLREALDRFALIDLRFETLPETFAFDVLGARKALAATEADLGRYILCEKEPVAHKVKYGVCVLYDAYRDLPDNPQLSGASASA